MRRLYFEGRFTQNESSSATKLLNFALHHLASINSISYAASDGISLDVDLDKLQPKCWNQISSFLGTAEPAKYSITDSEKKSESEDEKTSGETAAEEPNVTYNMPVINNLTGPEVDDEDQKKEEEYRKAYYAEMEQMDCCKGKDNGSSDETSPIVTAEEVAAAFDEHPAQEDTAETEDEGPAEEVQISEAAEEKTEETENPEAEEDTTETGNGESVEVVSTNVIIEEMPAATQTQEEDAKEAETEDSADEESTTKLSRYEMKKNRDGLLKEIIDAVSGRDLDTLIEVFCKKFGIETVEDKDLVGISFYSAAKHEVNKYTWEMLLGDKYSAAAKARLKSYLKPFNMQYAATVSKLWYACKDTIKVPDGELRKAKAKIQKFIDESFAPDESKKLSGRELMFIAKLFLDENYGTMPAPEFFKYAKKADDYKEFRSNSIITQDIISVGTKMSNICREKWGSCNLEVIIKRMRQMIT